MGLLKRGDTDDASSIRSKHTLAPPSTSTRNGRSPLSTYGVPQQEVNPRDRDCQYTRLSLGSSPRPTCLRFPPDPGRSAGGMSLGQSRDADPQLLDISIADVSTGYGDGGRGAAPDFPSGGSNRTSTSPPPARRPLGEPARHGTRLPVSTPPSRTDLVPYSLSAPVSLPLLLLCPQNSVSLLSRCLLSAACALSWSPSRWLTSSSPLSHLQTPDQLAPLALDLQAAINLGTTSPPEDRRPR